MGVEVLHHGGFERLDLLDTGLQVPPGGKNTVIPKMRSSPKKEVRLQGASEGEGTEQRKTDRAKQAKVPGGGGGLKGDLQNVCDFAFAMRKIVLFEFGESGIERRFVELESLRKTSREKIMNEAAKMFGGAGITGTQKPWRAFGKKKLTVLVRERIRKIAAQWFELGQTEAKQGQAGNVVEKEPRTKSKLESLGCERYGESTRIRSNIAFPEKMVVFQKQAKLILTIPGHERGGNGMWCGGLLCTLLGSMTEGKTRDKGSNRALLTLLGIILNHAMLMSRILRSHDDTRHRRA